MVKQTIVAGMTAMTLALGLQVLPPTTQGETDEWLKILSVEVNDEIYNPGLPKEVVAEVNDELYAPRLAEVNDEKYLPRFAEVNDDRKVAEVNDELYAPRVAEVNDELYAPRETGRA